MPYIHPDLGVSCMTMGEFWASEAKKEGREAHELMDDFYSEMVAEEQRSKQHVMKDKIGALEMLKSYYDPEYGDIHFTPVEILSIISADVRINMRSNTTTFTAEVKCSDGNVRTLEYTETQYAGSYMEPPDFDCNCRIVKE